MGNPIFNIDLLKHYQVLDRPGTFIVTVAHDVTDKNLFVGDDYPRYLINLRVILSEDLPKLVELLKDSSTVPYYSVRDYFLTGAIFDNDDIDPTDLPIKGEKVVATFDYKDDKLICTHVKLIDRDNLLYVNFNAIDDMYSLAKKFLS